MHHQLKIKKFKEMKEQNVGKKTVTKGNNNLSTQNHIVNQSQANYTGYGQQNNQQFYEAEKKLV